MITDEFKDKVVIKEPGSMNLSKDVRTMELTEEERNYLVNLGVNKVLRDHIISEKTKKETN